MHARDVSDLEWYFNDCEGAIKRDVRSLQSGFEAEMDARSKLSRHRVFSVEDGRGRFLVRGTELACGCGAHSTGSHEGARLPEHPDDSDPILFAVARERRVSGALDRAGPLVALALRLRFREVLPECREPFGVVGGTVRRARTLAMNGIRKPLRRGQGNLAHLTEIAAAAHDGDRTRLDLSRWVDRLGNRLREGHLPPGVRALGRAIAHECEILEHRCLGAYHAARERVPERVRRAGARMGA